MRFWNTGLEGQMIFGSIFCTYVAIIGLGTEPFRLVQMRLAAAAGGTVGIAIPALFRIRFNLYEIISTLLLNDMTPDVLFHRLHGSWKDPKGCRPSSAQYDAFERLPLLGQEATQCSRERMMS